MILAMDIDVIGFASCLGIATPLGGHARGGAGVEAGPGLSAVGRPRLAGDDSTTDRLPREIAMRSLLQFAVAAIGITVTVAAHAHHGWSGQDAETPLTPNGTVKDAGYEQPQGFVRLQTKEKLCTAVLARPYRMESRGLPREWLKAGAVVTVVGYPHKSDAGEMRAERITINGKTIELR